MDFFNEYTKRYDMDDPRLSYKYFHSIRVMDNMLLLAKNLNLSESDTKIAKYIGLFHDLGRFEQYTKYQSFNDHNLDHGDYAADYLKEHNILKRYGFDEYDSELIHKAIREHNKFMISKDLTERELLFTKMIRDADKLDILYALGNPEIKEILREDDGPISEEIATHFFNEEIIKNRPESYKNEQLITVFGFIYDINFDSTFKIIKENDYYNKIYKRLRNQEVFKPYIEKVNEYIEKRTEKHVR